MRRFPYGVFSYHYIFYTGNSLASAEKNFHVEYFLSNNQQKHTKEKNVRRGSLILMMKDIGRWLPCWGDYSNIWCVPAGSNGRFSLLYMYIVSPFCARIELYNRHRAEGYKHDIVTSSTTAAAAAVVTYDASTQFEWHNNHPAKQAAIRGGDLS